MRHRKEWIRAVNKIPFVSLNAFCLPALGKGRMRRVGAEGHPAAPGGSQRGDVSEFLPARMLPLHQNCPRDSVGQCQPAWGEDFWGEDLGCWSRGQGGGPTAPPFGAPSSPSTPGAEAAPTFAFSPHGSKALPKLNSLTPKPYQ